MNIRGIDCTNSAYEPYKNISFGAVHPVRYFIKCEDGSFHKVVELTNVKILQRKLIGWLNKNFHSRNNISQEKLLINKPDKPSKEATLYERFIKFFTSHDSDYAMNKTARSFYTENGLKEAEPYIITGDTTDIVEEVAKPIGKARKEIKDKKKIVSQYYGISGKEAGHYLSHADILKEVQAVKDYQNIVKKRIYNILAENYKRDSILDVYFIPHIEKGKKIYYELTDARFNKKA